MCKSLTHLRRMSAYGKNLGRLAIELLEITSSDLKPDKIAECIFECLYRTDILIILDAFVSIHGFSALSPLEGRSTIAD